MPRSDKGQVPATERDLKTLPIVGHHSVVRTDHVRELLSLLPGGQLKDPASGLLSDTTVKDQLDRWRRAGWIESARVLANQPAYIWLTRRGLQAFGLDELYSPKVPSLLRFHHYWCVMAVRLNWWDQNDPEMRGQWIPERRLRAEAMWSKHIPEDHVLARIRLEQGAIPDSVVAGNGFTDAIEVQLSALKPEEMKNKINKLLRSTYREVESDKVYIYNDIHFYVPSEPMKRHIEAACKHLSDEQRERIDILVDPAFEPIKIRPYKSSSVK